MHIFLTGERGAGKSTALRRFLAATGIAADGFLTVFDTAASTRTLYLQKFDTLSEGGARYRAAIIENDVKTVFGEVFDTRGTALLAEAGRRELILMDELGFMEEDSRLFQNAVLERLDGGIPVAGVIKPMDTPFLNTVRSHPKVEVLTVTAQNRDSMPEILAKRFGWELK